MIHKQLVLCSYLVLIQLQLKLHQASQPNNFIQILQIITSTQTDIYINNMIKKIRTMISPHDSSALG